MNTTRRVALATHPLCLAHDPGLGQPENPFRLQAILQAISSFGFSYEQKDVPLCDDVVRSVHKISYLDQLEKVRGISSQLEIETFTSASSIDAAYMSASIGCSLVQRMVKKEIDRAFAIIRPPGHHASSDKAMGYCIINNIAVAVEQAKRLGIEKIAIIDLDVHYGNGTQSILSGDKNCVHIDFHEQELFPEEGGNIEECGVAPAKGHLVNIPFPPLCGGKEYIRAVDEVVAPILKSFKPDIIFVSSGYDAHEYDGMSSIQLTYTDYYDIYKRICALADKLCDGKVICFLEGGYSIAALQSSVVATIAALNDQRCPDFSIYPLRVKPVADFESVLDRLKKKIVDVYWK